MCWCRISVLMPLCFLVCNADVVAETSTTQAHRSVAAALLELSKEPVVEQAVYRETFSAPKPPGHDLVDIVFHGSLKLVGIQLEPPSEGIPARVEVAQARQAVNCKFDDDITRNFELFKEETASASLSNTSTLTHTGESAFEAQFGVPVFGDITTTFTYSLQYSTSDTTSQNTETKYGWKETLSEKIPPGKRTVVQVVVRKTDGSLAYEALVRLSGSIGVTFKPTGAAAGPVCLRASDGQHFLSANWEWLRPFSGARSIRADKSSCNKKETFWIEDKNGGELLDGDVVYVRSAEYNTYMSVQRDTILGNVSEKSTNEEFIVVKKSDSGEKVRVSDTVSFRSKQGRHLSAQAGGGAGVDLPQQDPGMSGEFGISASAATETYQAAWEARDGQLDVRTVLGEQGRDIAVEGWFRGDIAAQAETVVWEDEVDCSEIREGGGASQQSEAAAPKFGSQAGEGYIVLHGLAGGQGMHGAFSIEADVDGDGEISGEEWLSWHAQGYAEADEDGNGQINSNEWFELQSHEPHLEEVDFLGGAVVDMLGGEVESLAPPDDAKRTPVQTYQITE